jgi:hypothetical protein
VVSLEFRKGLKCRKQIDFFLLFNDKSTQKADIVKAKAIAAQWED